MLFCTPNMYDQENGVDETDRLPSKDRVSDLDIAGFVISITSHIVDVVLDCYLAYRYYLDNQMECFVATLGFILVPALINTAFSIRMYVMDQNEASAKKTTLTKKFTKRRVCCIIVLIFQLAPILRYFDALRYALKSRRAEKTGDVANQRKYYELMVKEDSDVALLRVLECFLEAAPQQILQLAIIFHKHGMEESTFVYQLLSIGASFVSMAWSMASYQRLLRFSLKDKNNISWAGTIIQFMWHFLVTISRILCISVIASAYLGYTVIGVLVHWLIMTIWLHAGTVETNFCNKNKLYDSALFATFGMVYVFTYVNLGEGRTFMKYLFFYLILFLENTAANVFWILTPDDDKQKAPYYRPVVYLNIIPFILGIVFMILYYKVFHPSTGLHTKQRNDRS